MSREKEPAPPLDVIASLIPASRTGIDIALATLQGERDESRLLVASIEELENGSLGPGARESLRDARAGLLDWLGEARRCAAAWKRHRDLLVALESEIVRSGGDVTLTGEGARALERLGESGAAIHGAAAALDERARELGIAKVRLALKTVIADPSTADATLARFHVGLHPG